MIRFAERGTFPETGGVMEQADGFLEAMELVRRVQNAAEMEAVSEQRR